MKYGELPKELGIFKVDCKEMMFYQYLPIKMPKASTVHYESRLSCFDKIIDEICEDFIKEYGMCAYFDSYMYITAKHMFQAPNCTYNRYGWHSDGFMTDDINYIWCDKFPTIFNNSKFILSEDDSFAMTEMEKQADFRNNIQYKENQLLKLNQYNIHKVAKPLVIGSMRTFLKISFSKDKYDLIGNSHNYLFDYNWEMKQRSIERNIPQSILTK